MLVLIVVNSSFESITTYTLILKKEVQVICFMIYSELVKNDKIYRV